jgi:isopropylmalate/homocitrate/citramalate synthase
MRAFCNWVSFVKKTVFRKLKAQNLIENYNRFRKTLPTRLPDRVFIWDETLTEGEHTPTVFLTYGERVRLAQLLDETGVSIINIGFPGFSEDEKEAVRRLSNENFTQARLAASARTIRKDIDACLNSHIREIALSTPFNNLNLKYVLKTSPEQILRQTVDCVEYAKKHGLIVNFVLEDASRTSIEDILKIYEAAAKAGTDRLVVEDTVGVLRPLSTHYLISRIRKGLLELTKNNILLSIRCHNDFGLATANTLAAIEEGITYPQVCVAGYGERTGLAPMEEVVVALELLYGKNTGIDAHKLYRLSQFVEKSFTWPLASQKPIVGEDAFSHASDKQVQGMLAHPLSYEPFPPKMIDRETALYMGRHLGEATVQAYLDLQGIKATPEQVAEIARRVRRSQERLDKGEMMISFYEIKKLLRQLRKGLAEEELEQIIRQVTKQKPAK